jgi:hypothetical protein
MRALLASVLACGSLMTAPEATPADDATAAKAVIEAAIKAHGGPQMLAKAERMVRQDKGVMSLFGQEAPFTDELILQLPQRWRWTLDAGGSGPAMRLMLVVTGDKGWQSASGTVTDISKERVEELREEAYVLWLSTLLPFIKDNNFTLTPLPEAVVDSQPAVGVKVAHKGHGDVALYFDKRTGLLVKTARRVKESGLSLDKEYHYSGHKLFEGLYLPTKYVELVNGRKFVEVAEISYRFPRAIDDSTFARP